VPQAGNYCATKHSENVLKRRTIIHRIIQQCDNSKKRAAPERRRAARDQRGKAIRKKREAPDRDRY